MSDITFEFATHDDCLDKMVPSDLRQLVAERDRLLEAIESVANYKYNRDSDEAMGKKLSVYPEPTKADEDLQAVANKVCQHIPGNALLSLCMENGAAWVELGVDKIGNVKLPDSADKSLLEQINDALCVANGWIDAQASQEPIQ